MRILIDDRWEDGYPDYHLHEGGVRIDVERWVALREIPSQYVSYSLSDWRMALNYLRDRGIAAVVRKVRSRFGERNRNRKWISVGTGSVAESASARFPRAGRRVAFVAPNHPEAVDRVVIDERFVRSADEVVNESPPFRGGPAETLSVDPGGLAEYAGWSRFSGRPVDEGTVTRELRRVLAEIPGGDGELAAAPPTGHAIGERVSTEGQAGGGVPATVVGLGNYVKTVVLPSIPDGIRVDSIHEIDPLQLGKADSWSCTVDTSPLLREDDPADIVFIAGYHHTHTPVALEVLSRGGYAVLEKPLCTTRAQLEDLRREMEVRPRVFSCFQKRYTRMNEWAREDLALSPGEPVSYHCIVFEVPLPERHWYNWPTSGSRIVSNGCHWLDHFMYLNGYAPVVFADVRRASSGDLSVRVELENSASFTMALTEQGSARLGLRDHVELRAKGVTARMVDDNHYVAEGPVRVLRKERVGRMDSYRRMYASIGEAVLSEAPGDPVESLRSTELMLDLEEMLTGTGAPGSPPGRDQHFG